MSSSARRGQRHMAWDRVGDLAGRTSTVRRSRSKVTTASAAMRTTEGPPLCSPSLLCCRPRMPPHAPATSKSSTEPCRACQCHSSRKDETASAPVPPSGAGPLQNASSPAAASRNAAVACPRTRSRRPCAQGPPRSSTSAAEAARCADRGNLECARNDCRRLRARLQDSLSSAPARAGGPRLGANSPCRRSTDRSPAASSTGREAAGVVCSS
mmetsp:Transcript_150604/g.419799  ORF Transcript_150604/g.419799 Transcript_150604/m.419799 type:complete len:212 (+) Transcript_150604:799-1434(+)